MSSFLYQLEKLTKIITKTIQEYKAIESNNKTKKKLVEN
jgi:hypothetical protein